VTNDLMRDHKLAFLEPRPFIRWRTSHIVYFGMSSGYNPDNSTDNSGNIGIKFPTPTNFSLNANSSIDSDITPFKLAKESNENGTAIAEEEVYLYQPGRSFSCLFLHSLFYVVVDVKVSFRGKFNTAPVRVGGTCHRRTGVCGSA